MQSGNRGNPLRTQPLCVAVLCLFLGVAPMSAGIINLNFSVFITRSQDFPLSSAPTLNQIEDLPITIPVTASLDDGVQDRQTNSNGTGTYFGPMVIYSPLQALEQPAFDLSALTDHSSEVLVWSGPFSSINLGQDRRDPEVSNSLSDVFIRLGIPPLENPDTFNSANLLALLSSHVGDEFDYLENFVRPSDDLVFSGSATLESVQLATPEPSTFVMLEGVASLVLLGLVASKLPRLRRLGAVHRAPPPA